jgi:arylsulfatase A-like enzyme
MKLFYSLILACTITLISCSVNKPDPVTPNIVWITSEDNSKHYLKLFDENGVSTPNIESLAENGIIFRRAFSNAPVCSVARSALISGCYGPRTGSQFHRKIRMVPLPDGLEMFPAYLREAGYYTANNSKEDYNFFKGDGVWDESSKTASYKNRGDGQPFFYVHNIGISHESSLHFTKEQMDSYATTTEPNVFRVLPNHPQTEIFKYTNAYYRDKIQQMDQKVGEILGQLQADGLMDNTFIFYFGDHGGVLPGSKGYLYETGLHVPLVVYVPPGLRGLIEIPTGTSVDGIVNFIDLGPTVLHLAGINMPQQVDGKPFLGHGISVDQLNSRQIGFSYADRFDEKYDMVRAVREERFKYIRNYQPFNYDGLMNNYRYKQLAYQEWERLYQGGLLNKTQEAFFKTKAGEMLYDLETDPHETINLANDPRYKNILEEMRKILDVWVKEMPDLSFYPEHHLIDHAFDNPVLFGQNHKVDIERYVDISSLSLNEFSAVKDRLEESLNSVDPWDRYWGLTVCSSFGAAVSELVPIILRLSRGDQELLNRVRAAEYLGLNHHADPVNTITSCLYKSEKPAEALLILNSIVLLSSFNYGYQFDIETEKLPTASRENAEVKRRLLFLAGEQE